MKRQVASTGEFIEDKPSAKAVKKETKKQLHIKVYSPFKSYFDGEANSISAENDTGPFDILPEHHRFISLLNACDLVIQSEDGERKIRISRGILHVRDDHVTVFLDV